MGKLKTINRPEIFGNWKMLHPDGTLMCRLSTKKANWYVERELADLVDERTIQLKFEPNGNGDTNPYLLEDKVGICVVCGTKHDLTTHHVVPYTYRRHLPESYKSHNSHDNLLICDRDHDMYERHATRRKLRLQNVYAPIDRSKREEISKYQKAVRAAHALITHADVIPDEKKLYLLERVAPYADTSVEGMTAFYEDARRNPIYHEPEINGEAVVAAVIAKGDDEIRAFIEGWRQHFLDVTMPQYLSPNWAVDWHKPD